MGKKRSARARQATGDGGTEAPTGSETGADLDAAEDTAHETLPHDVWPERSTPLDMELQTQLRSAFAEADEADLLDLLKHLPPQPKAFILRALGTPHAPRVTQSMVRGLIARQTSRPSVPVASALMDSHCYAFTHAHIEADEWVALLAGEWREAVEVLEKHPALALQFAALGDSPKSILRLGLLSAALDSSAWVPALAFLALENKAAAEIYEQLRVEHPEFPVAVRNFSHVTPGGLAATAELADDTASRDRALAALETGLEYGRARIGASDREPADNLRDQVPEPPIGMDSSENEPQVTAQGVKSVAMIATIDWDRAAELASSIFLAADQHEAPDHGELDELVVITRAAYEATRELSSLLDDEVAANEDSIAEAVARVQVVNETTALLTALTQATGPAGLDDQMSEVRALANAALADETEPETRNALIALAQLAALGQAQRITGQPNYAESARLDAAARPGLPINVLHIIHAAMYGDVVLATGAYEQVEEAEVEPHEALVPQTDPAEDPVPVLDLDSDENPADITPVDPVIDEELAATSDPDDTSADEEQSTDAMTVTGDGEPAGDDHVDPAVPVDESEDVFDLDDFGAFLASPEAGSARVRESSRDVVVPAAQPRKPSPAPVQDSSDAGTQSTTGQSIDFDSLEDRELHQQLRRVETGLLSQDRFGLASLLHRTPSHAAARRLAGYQAYLTSSTGELASAFAEDQPLISREELGDDQNGQLLAWAAAARVAILAPASAAAQVLTELSPRLTSYPALLSLGTQLATASLNGAIATSGAHEDVAARHEAETAAKNAVSNARELIAVASTRNVKYAPANHVYAKWMASDGALGSLLGTVVANNPTTAPGVMGAIVDLRRRAEKLIDDTFASVVRPASKSKRVHAGARQKLRSRIEDTLKVAQEWADATTLSTDIQHYIHGAAQGRRPLENLRQSASGIREAVFADLAQMRESCDTTTVEGQLEEASVAAAGRMIVATYDALDGNPPSGDEPTPAWVVRNELLGTDISLDSSSLHPTQPNESPSDEQPAEREFRVEQAAAVELAAAAAVPEQDIYDLRARRGEHDITEVLVTNLENVNLELGIALRVQRQADVHTALEEITREIDLVTNRVNSARRDETLPERIWATLLAEVTSLRASQRRDFAAIRTELARIAGIVDDHKDELVVAARVRIEEKAAASEVVAQHRDTLLAIIDGGDVAGADEYLEQLTSGRELPEIGVDNEHLRLFFTAVPTLAAQNPDLLHDLHAALSGEAATAPVLKLFELSKTNPTAGDPASRPVGRASIGAWNQLAGSLATAVANGPSAVKQAQRHRGVDVSGAVKAILMAFGYEFAGGVDLDSERSAGRAFGVVRSVKITGKAMAPALGSRMDGTGGRTMRLLLVGGQPTPRTLFDWVSEERSDQTVLVLYLGGALTAEQRRALAEESRRRPQPVTVVVDTAMLAYIACQPQPSLETLAHLALPFTASSPYRDTPGDTPLEMFYGRVEEQEEVLDRFGPSFVSGGRQLGKSALLRKAQRRFDNGGHRRAVLVEDRQLGLDGHPEAIWPMLAAGLATIGVYPDDGSAGVATADSVSSGITAWLAEHDDRALLVLVDEADNFLTADAARNRFIHVGACKRLMEQEGRRVKFVFAGLHRTSRFESLSNQPLAHMGKPIVVGPLRSQAAHNLIIKPLAAMGFVFDDARTQTARILAHTNSVPSLLQLFGRALIEHVTRKEIGDGPPQRITDADITEVLDDKDLAHLFREKYILTLNLDHRYQVIVHVVALAAYEQGVDAGLRLPDLVEQCREYWPRGFFDVSVDYMRGLVAECCDLGLLTLDAGRYRMRTPYVLRLLGTEDEVRERLFDSEETLSLPTSLDAGSYRDQIPGSSKRSPLTTRQVGRLFSNPGDTLVVVGSEALAAEWAPKYLMSYFERGKSGEYQVTPLKNWTAESLVNHAQRLTRSTMLVADMRTASETNVQPVLAAEQRAHQAAKENGKDLIIVFVVTPSSIGAWLHQDERIVDLERVDDHGLRMWCEESDATFDTPEEWADLAEATGGWPILVDRVLSGSTDGVVIAPTKRVEKLREDLLDPTLATRFMEAAGLGDLTAVSIAMTAVFSAAAEWTADSAVEVEDLIAILTDAEQGIALPDAVRAGGFASIEDVLRALELVGALVESTTDAGDGHRRFVATEPVLTRAFRLSRPTIPPEREDQ